MDQMIAQTGWKLTLTVGNYLWTCLPWQVVCVEPPAQDVPYQIDQSTGKWLLLAECDYRPPREVPWKAAVDRWSEAEGVER